MRPFNAAGHAGTSLVRRGAKKSTGLDNLGLTLII